MPKFITEQFRVKIQKKGIKRYPFFYLLITFVSLMYIDFLYKFINYGILFDPDIVHILLLDMTLAAFIMSLLILIPRAARKYVLLSLITIFTFMGFLYSVIGFEGVISTSFNNLNILATLWNRISVNFVLLDLLFLLPLLLWFIRVPVLYTRFKYSLLVLFLMLSATIGLSYTDSSKYNSRIEVTTNLERIIYNDEGSLLFNRLGVNVGLLRNLIDFDDYNLEDQNTAIASTVDYFNTTKNRNEYTNIFKGYNLIVVEIENLDYMALNAEVMPTLLSLVQSGIHFPNYFDEQSLDQNFEFYTGIYENSKSLNTVATYGTNQFPNALANQFGLLGYETSFIQNKNDEYQFERNFVVNTGYNEYYESYDFSNVALNDIDLIEQSSSTWMYDSRYFVNYKLKGLSDKPTDYSAIGDSFEDMDIPQELKMYYSYANETDQALTLLLNKLSDIGDLTNTVLLITSTGHPDYFEDDFIKQYSSKRSDVMINRVPFVMWGGLHDVEIDEVLGSANIPATLANMFGFLGNPEYIAKDVFESGENHVAFNDRSWISNAGYYDSKTQRFLVSDNKFITDYIDEYIQNVNAYVYDEFMYSRIVLEKNYFIQYNVWYIEWNNIK